VAKSVAVTEKMAAVYQRGHWLISNVSDVRIIWNITPDTVIEAQMKCED
jgi:hypothetical protein